MNELKTMITGKQPSTVYNQPYSAILSQNTPNPFINITAIQYNIPQQVTTAQLVIHDNNGKVMKQVKISDGGKGSVNIDASTLSAGTYTYSLMVDEKVISTKQMMLTK